MKKLLVCFLLALLIVIGGIVAYCGFGGMEPKNTPTADRPDEVITLLVLSQEEENSAAACALQAKRGILVDFANWDAEELETQLAAENTECDVLRMEYSFGCNYSAQEWMRKGYFAELDRPVVKEAVEHMWPGLQCIAKQEDAIMALPVAAKPYVLLSWQTQVYPDWDALINTEGFLLKDDGIVWACLLEQYVLGVQEGEYSFNTDAFEQTLIRAKTAYNTPHQSGIGLEIPEVSVGIGARVEQTSVLAAEATADRLGWLPSSDGKWRIPMKASVLVVPQDAPHMRQAQDYVAETAHIGLCGALSQDGMLSFGGNTAAACYEKTMQMVWTVGEDMQNLERWRQIMQQAQVTPEAGFLTECFQQEIGDYFTGRIDEATCAAAVQARWNARRKT